jgi:hypothetical protein
MPQEDIPVETWALAMKKQETNRNNWKSRVVRIAKVGHFSLCPVDLAIMLNIFIQDYVRSLMEVDPTL